MKVTYQITAVYDGNLDELLREQPQHTVPSLAELLAVMEGLAFVVETVAHLQGRESALLPHVERARRCIDALSGTQGE